MKAGWRMVVVGLFAVLSLFGAERPNIVLIFTDDQGYGDVGCYGAKGFETPNIDRLAREGRRFTSFYVAQPVCSASRTALLTGCYPNRIGIHGALGPNSKVGINSNEVTLAEMLKGAGYQTAIFGKWHLGSQAKFLPTHHGFDEYYGLPYSNDMWPFHPEAKKGTYPDLPLIEGEKTAALNPDQSQLTTEYTRHAVDFISRNKRRPFFLYLAHSMPHVPLHVSDKFKGKTKAGLYGDVIEEIDWSVGEVMKALRENGIENNTWVIFTCDNGPWLSYGNHAGSSGGLREGKGTVWEGGVREPCIMKWSGHIPANSVCDEPAMTIDLMPTIAEVVKAELPRHKIDGLNIWPLIAGEAGAKNPHEAYYFYYNVNELQAARSGKWKLMAPHTYRSLAGEPGGTNGIPAKYKNFKVGWELYDLENDPKETKDVASANPEVVKRMRELMEKAREDMGDSLAKRKGANVREAGRVQAE